MEEEEYKYTRETEHLLFSDAELVRRGVELTDETDANSGKIVSWLGDLPMKKCYITKAGNRIERISDFLVKFGMDKQIVFPQKPVPRARDREQQPQREMSVAEYLQSTSGQVVSQSGSASPSEARRPSMAPSPSTPPALQRLLDGEVEFLAMQDVEWTLAENVYLVGTLFVTNYQLQFQYPDDMGRLQQRCVATMGSITRVEKLGGQKSGQIFGKERQVVIHRKDFHREVKLSVRNAKSGDRKKLIEIVNRFAFPGDIRRMFAFAYKPKWQYATPKLDVLQQTLNSECNLNVNGWDLYRPESDYARMRVQFGDRWVWTEINKAHQICKSYPEKFVVPAGVGDVKLAKAASFRTKGRMPMLSWVHKNGASITRSSQPKVGALSSRCSEDELLLSKILETNTRKEAQLMILDPRPRTNAEANKYMGSGYEKPEFYRRTQILFLDVANIHVMRSSQQALRALCHQPARTDTDWYTQIDQTLWLSHIQIILAATAKVIKEIHKNGNCVLVHCSDGWDRTSQVVSLAMMCMDPFYRTLSGFCILIEKEWVNAGHMFVTRLGHASANYTDENRAPIFLQWIDCVWQLLRQYPLSFEFNEVFLMRIIDEASNCRFGTFIADNDHSRKLFDVEGSTVSLWSYFHRRENFYNFLNPLYSPPIVTDKLLPAAASRSDEIIHPRASMKSITMWLSFYLRSRNYRDKAYEVILERAFEMQCKIEELQLRLQEAERRHQAALNSSSNGSGGAAIPGGLMRAQSIKPGSTLDPDNGGDDDAAVFPQDPDADAQEKLMERAISSALIEDYIASSSASSASPSPPADRASK